MTTITRNGGEVVGTVPAVDFTDPGALEAWYGNYGFFAHEEEDRRWPLPLLLAPVQEPSRSHGEGASEVRPRQGCGGD
jgi:hypothetical protein